MKWGNNIFITWLLLVAIAVILGIFLQPWAPPGFTHNKFTILRQAIETTKQQRLLQNEDELMQKLIENEYSFNILEGVNQRFSSETLTHIFEKVHQHYTKGYQEPMVSYFMFSWALCHFQEKHENIAYWRDEVLRNQEDILKFIEKDFLETDSLAEWQKFQQEFEDIKQPYEVWNWNNFKEKIKGECEWY